MLYRRSTKQIEVSLPDRRYELAGRLLAQSVEESTATGAPVQEVLHRRAEELGRLLGEPGSPGPLDLLERYGFEPRNEEGAIVAGRAGVRGLPVAQPGPVLRPTGACRLIADDESPRARGTPADARLGSSPWIRRVSAAE